MTTDSVPPIPSDRPVTLPREACELLALVDFTTSGRRVLDILLSRHSPADGTVVISKRELTSALGATLPAVNRGLRELTLTGVVRQVEGERGRYLLHPLLTGAAADRPEAGADGIRAIDPDAFKEQRRRRYDLAVGAARPAGGAPYVPPIPTDEPVSVPREVCELLALVDLTATGRRVLDVLLSRYAPEDGTAGITQREMAAALGAAFPAVNRGFRELAQTGLAWGVKGGRGVYQLHPLLTGGAVSSPVMACPVIQAVDPDSFSAQRRLRYATQIASLPNTA
ncbi:hypothetical protein LO771_28860 [Streptacidiphilus sp. ASG 303]|uniref:hypothetical protein n=1 Tax=Streptacidiphilus sp. ASG 303 TaxID=2896847 RepID=UPI001E49C021|nr:hypothetical protein [Streptacidiphilus sp. ASG 303]MCD0486284.1 hypothetical protein [Streptacidiphilus sp. ASG 303]